MGGRWIKFAYLETSGNRGSIMMMWDCRTWKGEVSEISAYALICKFEAQLQSFSCHLTGVYAQIVLLKEERFGKKSQMSGV